MRKMTFYCDRCGKELTGRRWQLASIMRDSEDIETADVESGADLCEECFQIVDKATADAIRGVVPEQPKAPKEKAIDLGKVKALREAGWSQAKIADEMGCSIPTISKALKKIFGEKEENHESV